MSIGEKEYKFKITVVGDPAVGKTTLVKKYTTGSFQKDYISTLGAQFSNYDEIIEGKHVKLFIWDISQDKKLLKLCVVSFIMVVAEL